jgi:hypothetical protein
LKAIKRNESEGTMNDKNGTNFTRRYPLTFGVRYVTAEPGPGRPGAGETVWMSGKEVAFLAKGPATVGDKVAMYIEWPVLLQGEVPLQLIVNAEIVQRSGPLSVARMIKYEFRTRGALSGALKLQPQPQVPFSTWDIRSARQMPASTTVNSVQPRQPVLASVAN